MESMELQKGRDAAQQAEAFAVQLHTTWGVGHKGCNDGVLLLLAVKDRQVRPEREREMAHNLTEASADRFRAPNTARIAVILRNIQS